MAITISVLGALNFTSFPLFLVSLCWIAWVLYASRKTYPPGPAKLPFIGNLLQVPTSRQWVKFLEWAQKYGPVFHLTVGPQHIIVLNSLEVIEDLFVRQSRIFSERYAPHVASDIMSAGQRMIFIGGSTEEFKSIRKALHSAMSPSSSRRYRPLQDLESCMMLYHLLMLGKEASVDTKIPDNGEDPVRHWYSLVNRLTTNISVMTMYGLRLPDAFGSKRMMAIHEVSVNVTHMALPGVFLADVFPVLRWLPDFLAPWRVKATRLHEWEYGVYGGFLNDIISDYKNGTDRPECFVGNYIKARSEHGLEDAPGKGVTSNGWIRDMLLAYSAGNVLEAGSDTTACTIKTVLLFLLSYPQVLEKVRNEIDSVVGPNRLPTVEDEPSLPYLIATIKEVMRCRPAIPLGLPHSPSEDTIYKGHLIPKGSIVIANAYALHMDSVRFPDPKAFKPERWFVCDDKTKPMRWGSGPEQDRDHYLFGWGRRFCPGSHIAEATLFITLSRLIWAFKFQAAGTPPDPWDEESYTAGFVTNPHKFDIKFEPRTATHADVVRRAFEEAQEQWETLGMERDGGVE